MDTREIDERYFTCERCGGTGKVQVPISKEDIEELGFTELYDVCPECGGIGVIENEGPDPDMYYDQRNEDKY